MKFEPGKIYLDRKGFEYACVAVTPAGFAVFIANKANGDSCLAARDWNGRYLANKEHDYDIVKEK